jgi:transcription antitermination factor NusA-like protein
MEFISLESEDDDKGKNSISAESIDLLSESPSKCSIAIAIQTKRIGLIIGKNGQNFKEISEISGSKFNIQPIDDLPQGSTTRCALIKGNSKSVLSAIDKILNKIQNKSSEGVLKWIILQTFTGILIGKGGSKIKSINERSGAWVKVAHIDESSSLLNER